MSQMPHRARTRTVGPWPRLIVAVLAAVALISGALNVRPMLDHVLGAEVAAPPEFSAVDGLVGVPERAETALDTRVRSLQDALRNGDEWTKGRAATMLGHAYLQKARETGDPGYYPKAETLFQRALDADDGDVDALVGLGTLALARHQFAAALDWGERARALNPHHAATYGVIGDAQIELGRYDEAVATVQAMVDLRPDLSSYSRVSYLRELMGDAAGAIVAMEQAATAGSGYAENVAWVRVQLGNLRFDGGFLTAAGNDYAAALAAVPGFVPALAGQARVAAADGDLDRAGELYAAAVRAIPLPEFVVAHGDVLSAAGRHEEAAAQYTLVTAIQQLYTANGVDTDLELALFTADHGRPEDLPRAVARARAQVAARPSIIAWDVLAWTLYRSGDLDGAVEASEQALRLGTQNALMYFHAGAIAAARGETERAISLLERALALNPHFSVRYAPEARTTLERLQNGEVTS
ncbi:MAG: tetratricopeptide repeat protein [Chloroflexia bacterium]|nr:tetratricopeptide repeat protein [Chloroflexia bacterium]